MRGYAAVGLFNPKCSANIGGALRAAECYGAAAVMLSGSRLRNFPTDVRKAWKHLPAFEVDSLQDHIPFGCVPVAVDLVDGAKPLTTYSHPERAFYIFGPEDGTLGSAVLSWCRDAIYIPTHGCMNLAATVNVVLYDRMAKSGAQFERHQRAA